MKPDPRAPETSLSRPIPARTDAVRLTILLATGVVLVMGLLFVVVALQPTSETTGPEAIALGARPGGDNGSTDPPWDTAPIVSYAQAAGRKPDFVLWFQSWSPRGEAGFPTTAAENLYQEGYAQVITWVPEDYTVTYNTPEYSLDAILSGRHDTYVRQYARDVAAWGRPVYLRPFHEMNGDWNPYGAGQNGNTPEKLGLAWRKIHRIFAEEGATNVEWVWSPNVGAPSYHPSHPMASYYPGDAYVDWLALDGYNWAEVRDQPWYSFDELYARSYKEITAISPKPLMIAEVASHTRPGDKAAWIAGMREDVPEKYPRIEALAWFHDNTDGGLWRMDTSAASRDAYRAMATDARWQGQLP